MEPLELRNEGDPTRDLHTKIEGHTPHLSRAAGHEIDIDAVHECPTPEVTSDESVGATAAEGFFLSCFTYSTCFTVKP